MENVILHNREEKYVNNLTILLLIRSVETTEVFSFSKVRYFKWFTKRERTLYTNVRLCLQHFEKETLDSCLHDTLR